MAERDIKPNKGIVVETRKGPDILLVILGFILVLAFGKTMMHNHEAREIAMLLIPIVFLIGIGILFFDYIMKDKDIELPNDLSHQNLVDSIFNTETALRKRIKNYMMIQATLVVRETKQMNWDKAISITSETLQRFNEVQDKHNGYSYRTRLLLDQYIEDLIKAIYEYNYAKKTYSQPYTHKKPPNPDELLKWHDLKEKGVITEEEFEEHKKRILK